MYAAALRRNEFHSNEPYQPYERAYVRSYGTRVGVYRWLACLSAVITIPVSIIAISWVWARVYYLTNRPGWMTEGELVHSFALAVGTMVALVGVAAIFARRYHQFRPGTFNEEWEKEKTAGVENAGSGTPEPG